MLNNMLNDMYIIIFIERTLDLYLSSIIANFCVMKERSKRHFVCQYFK